MRDDGMRHRRLGLMPREYAKCKNSALVRWSTCAAKLWLIERVCDRAAPSLCIARRYLRRLPAMAKFSRGRSLRNDVAKLVWEAG